MALAHAPQKRAAFRREGCEATPKARASAREGGVEKERDAERSILLDRIVGREGKVEAGSLTRGRRWNADPTESQSVRENCDSLFVLRRPWAAAFRVARRAFS